MSFPGPERGAGRTLAHHRFWHRPGHACVSGEDGKEIPPCSELEGVSPAVQIGLLPILWVYVALIQFRDGLCCRLFRTQL